jgi:hypothetical protein
MHLHYFNDRFSKPKLQENSQIDVIIFPFQHSEQLENMLKNGFL